MSRAIVSHLSEMLDFCKTETLNAAARVPEEKRLFQAAEGKAHPLWLVGHLAGATGAVALQWGLGLPGVLPPTFRMQFAPGFLGGDPITPDASKYPSWEECLEAYRTAMNRLIEEIAKLQDEDLSLPPRGEMPERLRSRFTNLGRVGSLMIVHDTHHRGQLSMLAALP